MFTGEIVDRICVFYYNNRGNAGASEKGAVLYLIDLLLRCSDAGKNFG